MQWPCVDGPAASDAAWLKTDEWEIGVVIIAPEGFHLFSFFSPTPTAKIVATTSW